MNQPRISIVVETITSREHHAPCSLADEIAAAIEGIDQQTYPQTMIERIVVVDPQVRPAAQRALAERFPGVIIVASTASNYFDAKNSGAAASTGELIVFLDGDCVPGTTWLEHLVARFETGATVVTGRTRYVEGSISAKLFSVTDFANVLGEDGGQASGIMLNNVAFRRSTILENPLDARIPRNGACYVLYHRLRSSGARILYEPMAIVSHKLDVGGLHFFRKHFDRGYDGYIVYQLDEDRQFRGTAYVRRFGGLALLPLTVRRILIDWIRYAKHREQIGVSVLALPWFFAVAAGTRLIELAGGLAASLTPSTYRAASNSTPSAAE